MKKFFVIFLILSLILFTAIIKNSTKKIDEDIFALEESLRSFNNEFENIKLEFEFLSSSEKLLKFQELYFDEKLFQKDINNIEIISEKSNKHKTEKIEIISKQ